MTMLSEPRAIQKARGAEAVEIRAPHVGGNTQASFQDMPQVDDRNWKFLSRESSNGWRTDERDLEELKRNENFTDGSENINKPTAHEPFALPKDKIIAISVIGGPSKGLTRRIGKPRVSIGRAGGAADIELDDPQVSSVHCAVGIRNDIMRLCDLDSQGGTYIDDRKISVAPLEHLSEFRIGSSLLLVTVLPGRAVSPADKVGEFMDATEE